MTQFPPAGRTTRRSESLPTAPVVAEGILYPITPRGANAPAPAGEIHHTVTYSAPALLTFREAAARLRCSLWTVHRLVREGALPVVTLSPHVRRIAENDLPTHGAATHYRRLKEQGSEQ